MNLSPVETLRQARGEVVACRRRIAALLFDVPVDEYRISLRNDLLDTLDTLMLAELRLGLGIELTEVLEQSHLSNRPRVTGAANG